ncbi:integrin alpha-L-like [Phasianus colchicus]|uniref:integrin alpha-L-like n=1 Tax=Phasianus colchicus TaxID=9054 RepID=UPI00129D7AF3|nr:integrin alpha-L-like [Phasianus colchicus]
MAGPITALMGVVLRGEGGSHIWGCPMGVAMGSVGCYGVLWPHGDPTVPPPQALFSPMGTFNFHPTPQRVLEVAGTPSFGYGVLMLSEGRVVVGAPNVGRLYGCQVQSGECREVELWGLWPRAEVGMQPQHPRWGGLHCAGPLTAAAAGVGGWISGLKAYEFKAIRDFMVEVMEQLSNSSFRFAAVQFSDSLEPVFALRDYLERPQPRELLRDVRQQDSFTDTFTAVQYVACVSADRPT